MRSGFVRKTLAWVTRWGFATLVALGACLAVCIAARVDVPADIPSFALQASAVYRLEVGAVVFAASYVASIAFVLALGNRGFSELSATGVKAHDLESTAVDQAIEEHDQTLEALAPNMREIQDEFAQFDRRESE